MVIDRFGLSGIGAPQHFQAIASIAPAFLLAPRVAPEQAHGSGLP